MKIQLIGAAVMAASVAACAERAADTAADAALSGEALIERGRYLVEDIGLCGDCHTPMTPEGPDTSRHLAGAELTFVPTFEVPGWVQVSPGLAGTIGGYDEEGLVNFLQTGDRMDGTQPNPPMPAFRFNEEDARAVTAYLVSLPIP